MDGSGAGCGPCADANDNGLSGVFARATSLAASESDSIVGHKLVDSGTRVSMTATKRGVRVQSTPLHLQPEIAGAGGGVIRATHRVWLRMPPALRALQPAGSADEMPFCGARRSDATSSPPSSWPSSAS